MTPLFTTARDQGDTPTRRTSATRRSLLEAAAGLGALFTVAGTAAVAAPTDPTDRRWTEFTLGLAAMHRNGLAAARNARAAGVSLDDLEFIAFAGLGKARDWKEGFPALMFHPPAAKMIVVRPCGVDR